MQLREQTPDQTITLRQVNQAKREEAQSCTMELSHITPEGLSLFSTSAQTGTFCKISHVYQNFPNNTISRTSETAQNQCREHLDDMEKRAH